VNEHESSGLLDSGAAWVALGDVAGRLLSLVIPEQRYSHDFVAAMGALAGFLLAVILFISRRRGQDCEDISDCLRRANLLFLENQIYEDEYLLMRRKCIREC
jgi:hypothetical protein